MELKAYYYSLTPSEREQYAERAGTTAEYIRIHLVPRNRAPQKLPKKELMQGLADASQGRVSFQEVLAHFYGEAAAA